MIALLRVAVSPVIKAIKMIIFWLCFSFLLEFYFNNFEISQSGLYSVSEEEYYATITWGKTNKLSKSAKMVKLSSLLRTERPREIAQWKILYSVFWGRFFLIKFCSCTTDKLNALLQLHARAVSDFIVAKVVFFKKSYLVIKSTEAVVPSQS